jgi:ABC-type enterochelin transport system ATPase subunit
LWKKLSFAVLAASLTVNCLLSLLYHLFPKLFSFQIDKLILEENETAQKRVDLLNQKFSILKEKTSANMKLLLSEIR